MRDALIVSEGLDRDRAVDETGNQLAVFGRRGARPFTKAEMERLYLRDGKPFTVTNKPPSPVVADNGLVPTLERWWQGLRAWGPGGN
jgi:hypothetical protein